MRRFINYYIASPWLAVAVLEGIGAAASCCIAYYLCFLSPAPIDPTKYAIPSAALLSIAALFLIGFNGLSGDRAFRNQSPSLWRVAAISLATFCIAAWAFGKASASDGQIGILRQKTILLIWMCMLLVIVVRAVFEQIYRSDLLTKRIVFIGSRDHAKQLFDLAREIRGRFEVIEHIDPENDQNSTPASSLLSRIATLQPAEVVVADKSATWHENTSLGELFADFRVTEFLDFFERESWRISVENMNKDWFNATAKLTTSRFGEQARRAIEIIVSAIVVIVVAPVMLIAALAIKLEDGGSVFFLQERVGRGGRPYTMYKFRSMKEGAESDGNPAWAMEQDARITRVGRVIRKVRIDELPQFANVLFGDMSIIGPRPERPYFVEQFSQSIPLYTYRHLIRPGITGWAQVCFRYGASLEDAKTKLSYDLFYVKNSGFVLNAIIVLKTFSVVLSGDGAR